MCIEATFARHEPEIERADPRGGGVQDAETVPAFLDRTNGKRCLRSERENCKAIFGGARAPCPTRISGFFAAFSVSAKACVPAAMTRPRYPLPHQAFGCRRSGPQARL